VNAWRFVAGLGAVSLLADIGYEGARSVTGMLRPRLGGVQVSAGSSASVPRRNTSRL
jgi:hypothetical protein